MSIAEMTTTPSRECRPDGARDGNLRALMGASLKQAWLLFCIRGFLEIAQADTREAKALLWTKVYSPAVRDLRGPGRHRQRHGSGTPQNSSVRDEWPA